MKGALAFAVITLGSTLIACEPSRHATPHFPVPIPTVSDPAPILEQAHALKQAGLADLASRQRYFSLLAEACESGNAADACLEADAFEPHFGQPLLAHGCAIGSEDACNALLLAEIMHDHKTEDEAGADVMRIFQLGCIQGTTPVCMRRSSQTDIALLKSAVALAVDYDAAQNHAFDACVATCRDHRLACTSDCDFGSWSHCPLVDQCAAAERACVTVCGVDAVATCAGPLDGDCGLPSDDEG